MENPGFCNWDRGHNSTLIIFEFEMQPTFTCMVTNGYKGFSLLYSNSLEPGRDGGLYYCLHAVVSQKCDTQSAQEALLVITITHFFGQKQIYWYFTPVGIHHLEPQECHYNEISLNKHETL